MIEMKVNKLSGEDKCAKVGKICMKLGQFVNSGDVLFNVESAKGNFAVKSQYRGVMAKISIEEGQTVRVGDVFAQIEGEEDKKASAQELNQKSCSGYQFGISKPKREEISCDFVVIGGGPAGYVAAIRAAQLGASAVLIEKDKIGGTCLNYGCIPTKTLIKSAHLLDQIYGSQEFGIITESVSVDFEKVMQRKNHVVEKLQQGIQHLLDYRNIRSIQGEATWADGAIRVNNKKIDATIHAKNTILAMGSSPVKLPIAGADLSCVITSQEALNMKEIPKSMTIIGGGVIGMEFAFIFNSFGTDVTVIEYMDDILFNFDEDVVEIIRNECHKRGIHIYCGAQAKEIATSEDGRGITAFEDKAGKHYVVGDVVLMAVGRRANLNSIDLFSMGVAVNERGNCIETDLQMRTSNPTVFAVGDITNRLQLAHVASHQGIVAVEAAMGLDKKMDYSAIPSAVFLSPEIGTVGLCEKEAIRSNVDYCISKFPFAANGKALSQGDCAGFVKIIADRNDKCILGATVIGPGASDMVSNFTYLIQHKIDYRSINDTIFAHPTTAEAVHEAILGIEDEAIHFA